MRGPAREGEFMRIISYGALLFAFQILAVAVWAGNIYEADYPVQYEVVNTSVTGKLLGKSCAMTLRDQAKTGVDIHVARNGRGSCHVLDSGKVYRGRENQKKSEIELVIPVGGDKARVENWQIVGTVQVNPEQAQK
jgi:hypothetical protein